MAHRIISQLVFTSARVFGRAFSEAYKQANAARVASKAAGGSATGAMSSGTAGLTLGEACQILNVSPPKNGQADMEQVMERFKRLFDQNDPKKGGSFYLQSKILRAREKIEAEVGKNAEQEAMEAEARKGFKPQMYQKR